MPEQIGRFLDIYMLAADRKTSAGTVKKHNKRVNTQKEEEYGLV